MWIPTMPLTSLGDFSLSPSRSIAYSLITPDVTYALRNKTYAVLLPPALSCFRILFCIRS
jgi:hypothetical protein